MNNTQITSFDQIPAITMTSIDIAELIQMDHTVVSSRIGEMLVDLPKGGDYEVEKVAISKSFGTPVFVYTLNQKASMLVTAVLNIKASILVIDRLVYLEKENKELYIQVADHQAALKYVAKTSKEKHIVEVAEKSLSGAKNRGLLANTYKTEFVPVVSQAFKDKAFAGSKNVGEAIKFANCLITEIVAGCTPSRFKPDHRGMSLKEWAEHTNDQKLFNKINRAEAKVIALLETGFTFHYVKTKLLK